MRTQRAKSHLAYNISIFSLIVHNHGSRFTASVLRGKFPPELTWQPPPKHHLGEDIHTTTYQPHSTLTNPSQNPYVIPYGSTKFSNPQSPLVTLHFTRKPSPITHRLPSHPQMPYCTTHSPPGFRPTTHHPANHGPAQRRTRQTHETPGL